MSKQNKTRGRLSSIDLLPEEAKPYIEVAYIELRKKDNGKEQKQILSELNEKLEELGIDKISASAFNRKAVRIARHGQRMSELTHIANAMGEKIEKMNESDVGKFLVETLRCALFDAIDDADAKDQMTITQVGKAATALKNIEHAFNMNIHTNKIARQHFSEAVDMLEEEGGITSKTAEKIRDKVLGVKKNAVKKKGKGDE